MKYISRLSLLCAIALFVLQIAIMFMPSYSLSVIHRFILVFFQLILFLIFAYTHEQEVENKKNYHRIIHYVLFVIYLYNLIYLLFIDPEFDRDVINEGLSMNLVPFQSIRLFINALNYGLLSPEIIGINLLGNILAFMPFGYFAYMLSPKMKKFICYVFYFILVIGIIEVIQAVTHIGSGDIDDLILNLLGTIIMYGIMHTKKSQKYIEMLGMNE